MTEYIISSESIIDLPIDFVEKLDVNIINSNYMIDDKIYLDDFGKSLDMEIFYENMENGATPTTSAINTGEYVEYFREILKTGKDIIHVCLSSGISGQYNFLLQAIDILKEEFPERKINPVDSRMASSGVGLLVIKLIELKESGMDLESLYNWAMDNRLKVINCTSNENLEYVARGGRISKTAADIGTLLKICPIIEVNNDGEMIVTTKIRTRKKLLKKMMKMMKENAIDGTDYDDYIIITHAKNIEFAQEFKEEIKKDFPKAKIIIANNGPTIGSHIGPGTITLFYWGNKRFG